MNDKTITVYNHHKNADKADVWQRTVIHGVEYSYHMEKTVSSNGAVVLTELFTVVIPVGADTNGRKYIDAVDYEKLPDNEVINYWTINSANNKDMIVGGISEKEIGTDYKVSALKKDFQKAGIVAGFSDNTDGAMLKHYKVVCK